MGLNVMTAGCSPDERRQLDSLLKKVLGSGIDLGAWNISLVKIGTSFSVSIDGPEPQFKGLTFVSAENELQQSIVTALRGAKASAASAPAPSAPGPSLNPPPTAGAVAPKPSPRLEAGEKSARHDCTGCGGAFDVRYRAEPNEPEEPAPVACPHCWEVNYIPIATGATMTGEYRAQQV